MNAPDFEAIESACDIIRRVAQQYEETSEEYRALAMAASALLSEAIRNTRESFAEFCESTNCHIDDGTLTNWIDCHPEAPVGTTTVIKARLFVVTADAGGGKRLVRVFPIGE
jgi:hypothetical protein